MIGKFIQSLFEEFAKPYHSNSNAIVRAESMPHTKFERVLTSLEEGFSSLDAGVIVGYYLPEERTIELQCSGEYGSVLGEDVPCVKPAFSSEEAKRIFDFFVAAMQISDRYFGSGEEDGYDPEITSIDGTTCSISHVYGDEIVIDGVVEQEAQTTCQWFGVEGVLKLSCRDNPQLNRTEACATWDDADAMIDAFRFETGYFMQYTEEGPTLNGALTNLIAMTWPSEESDGTISFEKTDPDLRLPYEGRDDMASADYYPDKGVIYCVRGNMPVREQVRHPTPVTVKNKMEAMLTFYRYAFPGG